jgi:hypothetical protein
MEDDMTHQEVAEMIDRETQPSDGPMEQLAVALGFTPGAPGYVRGMRMVFEGIDRLEDLTEECSADCDDPTCITSPVHRKLIGETDLQAAIVNLHAAAVRTKAALVDVCDKTINCHCPACDGKRREQRAPYN